MMMTKIDRLPAGGFFWYEGKLYHKTWSTAHKQGHAAQAVSLEETGIKYDKTHGSGSSRRWDTPE